MKKAFLWLILILAAGALAVTKPAPQTAHGRDASPHQLALTPPMGWNSYDSLLTNPEVLSVDQDSEGNREILGPQDAIICVARDPESAAKYVAFFNTGSKPRQIAVTWSRLGIRGEAVVRDLWRRKDLGNYNGAFQATINPHGAGLYKLTPAEDAK